MNVATSNKVQETAVGGSVFAPVAPEDLYEAVLDVRGFPAWAPGVRRVEVLSGEGEAGMLSEWEVSFLGFKKKVLSVLEEAEAPYRLRWAYEGPLEGWGECCVDPVGDGAVAIFTTALAPADPFLAALARGKSARSAARSQLRRSLLRLGQLVAGHDAKILVGPSGAAPQKPTQFSSVASIQPAENLR